MLNDELRQMIRREVAKSWPEVAPELIEAQVLVESAGNPRAESACGARGLLQIMPDTARGLGIDPNTLWDPAINLYAGITYLLRQFEHFGEIGQDYDRMNYALAAYNGGRGYVNKALALARAQCAPYTDAKRPPWLQWDIAGPFLLDRRCVVSGKHPDGAQMLLYVARIRCTHFQLTRGQSAQEA